MAKTLKSGGARRDTASDVYLQLVRSSPAPNPF